MDIPMNVPVHCTDGIGGRSTITIINPITRQVSHLVVKEKAAPHTERLVRLRWVDRATPELILLNCTREKLSQMDPFVVTEYLNERLPNYDDLKVDYLLRPFRVAERPKTVTVKHHRIPPGELAMKRGTSVHATDGRIGNVDEFLVDPEDSYITHLILREGHLWGQKDVAIPISEIDHFDGETVELKLDKRSVGALPSIRVKRP